MKREMENESKKQELDVFGALLKFQKDVPQIKKDSQAGDGRFGYKYGSLPSILETINPHMHKHGLVITQTVAFLEGSQVLTTVLRHVDSGTQIESQMRFADVKFKGMNEVQSMGSEMSYLRRYSLTAILGIVADDDNDAQGDTEPKAERVQANINKIPEKKWLNKTHDGHISDTFKKAVEYLAGGGTISDIKAKYKMSKATEEQLLNEALLFQDDAVDVVPDGNRTLFDDSGNINE